jgi:hypothetical protein
MDDNNIELERRKFEYNKYGRQMNQAAAAQPHVYYKHSIEPAYGQFSEPSQEIV